ncbi:hypothetical protein ABEB36_006507 [Hypothenemus hampei]|uniref:InaF motif containing 2 n=1 Tax=Hypothenemus hampei TaxID=57062 RepID=A0ABD1EQS7_HYPHA
MSSKDGTTIEARDDFPQPKKNPKAIRVLTVLAYVLSVSMAAILLSIYYIFMWHSKPHLGAHTMPEHLLYNDTSYRDSKTNQNNGWTTPMGVAQTDDFLNSSTRT